MSRPSHAVADFTAPNGKTYHADFTGVYHDGPAASCEACRVLAFRRAQAGAQAYAETVRDAPAVKPRMNSDEVETVRAVNRLLKRDKPPALWPYALVGALAGIIAGVAILHFIKSLFS